MRDRRKNIGSFIIKERWSPYLVEAGLGMLSRGIFLPQWGKRATLLAIWWLLEMKMID